MYRACAKCGKIHDASFKCSKREYSGGAERKMRSQYSGTKKSEEIREKANHLCEVCKDKGVWAYDNLEVHHIDKLKDNQTGFLDNCNLICLCTTCHKKADKGLIDKEYMLRLARDRESIPPAL
jgi:5-methylcytosine-specific restriction endonuclease McrA